MTTLSEKHRANLLKLAEYLEKLPVDYRNFDMMLYSSRARFAAPQTSCGSVGCAIGHGPDANIPALKNEDWTKYSSRAFIPSTQYSMWRWCFSPEWAFVDNTPQGAAKRIRWLLAKGLPEDWYDQMSGYLPLCYKEPAHA